MTKAQVVGDAVPDIPMDRREIVYPRMTPQQLARIASDGARREVRAGEEVYRQGDEHVHLFVVVKGQLDVVRPQRPSGERAIGGPGPSSTGTGCFTSRS